MSRARCGDGDCVWAEICNVWLQRRGVAAPWTQKTDSFLSLAPLKGHSFYLLRSDPREHTETVNSTHTHTHTRSVSSSSYFTCSPKCRQLTEKAFISTLIKFLFEFFVLCFLYVITVWDIDSFTLTVWKSGPVGESRCSHHKKCDRVTSHSASVDSFCFFPLMNVRTFKISFHTLRVKVRKQAEKTILPEGKISLFLKFLSWFFYPRHTGISPQVSVTQRPTGDSSDC